MAQHTLHREMVDGTKTYISLAHATESLPKELLANRSWACCAALSGIEQVHICTQHGAAAAVRYIRDGTCMR